MHDKLLRSVLRGLRTALQDRRVQLLLGMSLSLIALATVFYHFQEGWRWIDSLYFSVITISTVGYGDFSPQTDLGKLFTVAYLFMGIGLFVVATATLAEHLLHHIKQQRPDMHDPSRSDTPF